MEALKEKHAKAEEALRAERDKAAKDLARLKQHLIHIVSIADGTLNMSTLHVQCTHVRVSCIEHVLYAWGEAMAGQSVLE